jgi:hypothetical protein
VISFAWTEKLRSPGGLGGVLRADRVRADNGGKGRMAAPAVRKLIRRESISPR